MLVSVDPMKCKLQVDKKIIEQVKNITYLRVEISSTRDNYKEVIYQALKTTLTLSCLKDITWNNKYLSI